MTKKLDIAIGDEMAARLKVLLWAVWSDQAASDGSVCSNSDAGDLSGDERELFGIFISASKSTEFASAMIEFIRRPCTQVGDSFAVKGGIPMMDYMDQLAEMGV